MKNLGNYKTTIVGIAGAVWVAIQPLLTKGDFELSRDWKQLVYAALIAGFGFLAKDYNVTGGTIPASNIDASVVKETTKTDKP
jgi:hypothetical protein